MAPPMLANATWVPVEMRSTCAALPSSCAIYMLDKQREALTSVIATSGTAGATQSGPLAAAFCRRFLADRI